MKKSRILFITVIFIIMSDFALSQAKQYEKGKESLNKGEYNTAISYFIEATGLAPQKGDYFYMLGLSYISNGQYDESVEPFKKALNLSHSKFAEEAWYFLASSYSQLGKQDSALLSIKKMIELAPDSSVNFLLLSGIYRKNKQYDEAITAAKRVIELKPGDTRAYIALGVALGEKEQYDEAIKALKKSIEINPKDKNAYAWMGDFFLKENAYNKAAEAYEKAIENAPNVPKYHADLADAYYSMGSYDEALAPINKAIELQTFNDIGISFDIEDNYPVVKEIINPGPAKKADLQIGDKIIEINGKSTKGWNDMLVKLKIRGPDDSQVILTIERSGNKIEKAIVREKIVQKEAASSIGFRSLIYRQRGNLSEAYSDAEMASSLNPSYFYAKLSLGAAYLDRGQYSESIKLLSHIENSRTARVLEATAYAKSGKINEAIIIYLINPGEDLSSKKYIPRMNDRMVLLQIFKPLVKEHREKAGSFESMEQYKEALSEFSEALKIADDEEAQAIMESMFSMIRRNPLLSEVPEDARRYAIIGETMIKEGNFEQAATEFKKAIRIAPYIAKLYFNTAYVDGQLKNYPEAIQYMKIYVKADPDAPNSRAAKDEIIKWEYLMEKEK